MTFESSSVGRYLKAEPDLAEIKVALGVVGGEPLQEGIDFGRFPGVQRGPNSRFPHDLDLQRAEFVSGFAAKAK